MHTLTKQGFFAGALSGFALSVLCSALVLPAFAAPTPAPAAADTAAQKQIDVLSKRLEALEKGPGRASTIAVPTATDQRIAALEKTSALHETRISGLGKSVDDVKTQLAVVGKSVDDVKSKAQNNLQLSADYIYGAINEIATNQTADEATISGDHQQLVDLSNNYNSLTTFANTKTKSLEDANTFTWRALYVTYMDTWWTAFALQCSSDSVGGWFTDGFHDAVDPSIPPHWDCS